MKAVHTLVVAMDDRDGQEEPLGADAAAGGPAPDPRAPWSAPAHAAVGLAFASAAVSAYWTLGGTLGLDTVGGAIEDLARERSAGGLVLGTVTVALKVLAGLLALGLARWRPGRPGRRPLLGLNGAASAILVLWGGANVVVGALVLAGAIDPSDPVDERALRWHVGLWDLWFLVWGAVLAGAVWRARRGEQGSG